MRAPGLLVRLCIVLLAALCVSGCDVHERVGDKRIAVKAAFEKTTRQDAFIRLAESEGFDCTQSSTAERSQDVTCWWYEPNEFKGTACATGLRVFGNFLDGRRQGGFEYKIGGC
jgi:hypothetical protein